MPCRPHLTVLLLALSACGSPGHLAEGSAGEGSSDPLAAIAQLEDTRSDGGSELQRLASDPRPKVRERAIQALGRLPLDAHGPAVTDCLLTALGDEAASVRSAAAFGLGLRADPAAAEGILANWRDPEPGVRAGLITAAGRIDNDLLRAKVLSSMRSPLSELRQAAVLAPHNWPPDEATDLALAEVASRLPQGDERAPRLGVPATALEDPAVCWRALFCLARRRADAGRDAFHVHRLDTDPLARLFSIKGLARITPHEAGRLALEESLLDPDWRVAAEAAGGLGAYRDHRSLDALGSALTHPSSHVRAAVAGALSGYEVEPARVSTLLASLSEDPSSTVQATALLGRTSLQGSLVLGEIEQALKSENPTIRGGAAQAAGKLQSAEAVPLLLPLTTDAHPRVAGLAIEALGSHDTLAVHARLLELLSQPDNGSRVAAATALEAAPRPGDLAALVASFETAVGDIAVDVQMQVLRTAAALNTPAATDFVEDARGHPHPWVRAVAETLAPGDQKVEALPSPERTRQKLPTSAIEVGARPRVAVVTSRGRMEFELFPDEAPVHVHSFLSLVTAGHYDGLDFHRVVPNFVIQGGCYRGDGNGTGTWRGEDDSIRHELTPRSYVRGSLGMPRSTEVDSGGSQLFVTHRPTPHLDGRYTIFGELRDGFEVLDLIEVGDRILSIERL